MIAPDQMSELLASIADAIDVGDAKYEDATGRYQAVGRWLDADDSALKPFRPDIYVQGSFSLGTAIKPYGDEGEYDIDALCVLRSPPRKPADADGLVRYRQWLRQEVGARLKASGRYGPMLQPPEGRRRCWTIQYNDESRFHLDVCPAIPGDPLPLIRIGVEPQLANHAVQLTDREHWDMWIDGNALGYRHWFRERMREQLDDRLVKVASAKQARVQDVPDYQARTTLQRAVQLLKRHRDILYHDDPDAPISIIITTLAAKAYDNDPDLVRALQTIVSNMSSHIRDVGGVSTVENPVNPLENFADKWQQEPRKREVFFSWLDAVSAFASRLGKASTADELRNLVKEGFGTRDGNLALASLGEGWAGWRGLPTGNYQLSTLGPVARAALAVTHALTPTWPVDTTTHTATVHCAIRKWHGFRNGKPVSSGEQVPVGVQLRFSVTSTVREPYSLQWQVTNTGRDAAAANQLRGGFYDSEPKIGKRFRDESTRWPGMHWVKCFVLKDHRVVARSEPFLVNIV